MFRDYEVDDCWYEDYSSCPTPSEQHYIDQLEEQRSTFEDQLRRVMDCLYGKIEFNLLESELEDLCGLADLKYPESQLMVQPKQRNYSFGEALYEAFSNNRKKI